MKSSNQSKFYLNLLLVFIVTIAVISCKKVTHPSKDVLQNDYVAENSVQNACSTENEVHYNLQGVDIAYEIDNEILRFANWEDYDNSVKFLDKLYEDYNEARDAQFANGLTEEEMDDLDDADGFDPFYTYKQLENRFHGFTSKRQIIERTEITWLNNDMTGIDPDSIDYTFDDSENTFFNENYEVKIGCIIYRMTEEGLVDLSNYEGLANNQSNSNEENQNSYSTESDDKCITNTRESDRYYYGANRMTKNKVAINTFFVRSSAKAKAVNYRQKNNGRWRRSRNDVAVAILGEVYDKQCNQKENIGLRNPLTGFKKRGEIRELYRWYEPLSGGKKTKKFRLASSWELSDRITNFIVFIK